MSLRILLTGILLLACWTAKAHTVDYDVGRQWVEKQCATNTIPEGERMFVFRWVSPKYAAIIRFHKGITLREIIDQTPVKGKVLEIEVMRTEPLKTGHYTTRHTIRIGPSDKPKFKLRSQDVIWLLDPGPKINV